MATFTNIVTGNWSDVDTWRSVSAWAALTNYAVNTFVKPTTENGFVYEVTTDAGSAGAVEPTWPTTIGNTVVDDGLTWTCRAGIPQDGDTVVVIINTVVTFDVDHTAFSTGINGITITSHATTPGKLMFKNDADGTYYLKMKSGTTIIGTNLATKGRLMMAGGTWASPTDLAFARKHIIEFLGTAASSIDMTYLDVVMKCYEPATTYVETYGTAYVVSSVTNATNIFDLGTAPPSAGTTVAIKSSGTLPAPLSEYEKYYIRAVSGNTCKLAYYNSDAGIVNITSDGTGTITLYTGYASGSTTVNVIQDVRAVTGWVGAATAWANAKSDNAVCLTDTFGATTYDQQRIALATINATTLVLDTAVDSAQEPLARVYAASRNVRVIQNSTNASGYCVTAGTGCTINAELRNLPGTGITYYGTGINVGTNHTIGGVISGFTTGITGTINPTISSIVLSCGTGVSSTSSGSFTGNISGCSSGIAATFALIASGEVSGCSIGINTTQRGVYTTSIFGCTSGLYQTYGSHFNGSIKNCSIGINIGTQLLSGSISNCGNGVYAAYHSHLSNLTCYGNQSGDLVSCLHVIGYNVTLNSANQHTAPTNNHISASPYTKCIYNISGLTGQIKAWMEGGTIVTESAPAAAPVTLSYAYKHTGISAALQTWVDIPFWAKANTDVNISIYEICNANPSTFTVGPVFEIIAPDYAWGDASAILYSRSAQTHGGNDTNWHTLTLTYTPITDRPLILRARMTDASKYFHWMFSMPSGTGASLVQYFG